MNAIASEKEQWVELIKKTGLALSRQEELEKLAAYQTQAAAEARELSERYLQLMRDHLTGSSIKKRTITGSSMDTTLDSPEMEGRKNTGDKRSSSSSDRGDYGI